LLKLEKQPPGFEKEKKRWTEKTFQTVSKQRILGAATPGGRSCVARLTVVFCLRPFLLNAVLGINNSIAKLVM